MNHLRAYIPIFIVLLTACTNTAKPQTVDTAAIIKVQAEKMAASILQKDFKTFAKFTYPAIVEGMGGEAGMEAMLKKGFEDQAAQGITIVSVKIGAPSKIVTAGNELQCTVPETIEMKMPNGRLVTNSTLIAISVTNGKGWYFIDTSGHTLAELQTMLPNISSQLVIPKKEQPTFYNN